MMHTFKHLHITVSRKIVADYGFQTYQITRQLKRAEIPEFINITAIIFIHCYKRCIIH